MANKFKSILGIGPMSSETVEAVFRYSHYHRAQLMLIASKNQIDYNGGYVNGWNTAKFMEFIKRMRQVYDNSDVKICRDHCGPGFNGIYDLEDVYKTIKADISNGFDLIHIDFCHYKGMKNEQLEESTKAIEYCLSLNPDIGLEIGTDENSGVNYSLPNLLEIEKEIDYFKSFCDPEFYVVQTGSLVKEINQAGDYNKSFTEAISKIVRERGVKLKEHNADYLSKDEIEIRRGVVDAMNIAPQLGVVQTQLVLSRCLFYGVKFENFIEESYSSQKWQKWLLNNTKENKFLCSTIAGHYNFNSPSYKDIMSKLNKSEDMSELIINSLVNIISHYVQ